MSASEITRRRLAGERLLEPVHQRPDEVVAWLGAVQAQDYPGARWGVGQRIAGATDAEVARAYAEGAILRTHVLRPTWHFLTAADLRWILALTGPRVDAGNQYRYRQLELDDAVLRKSRKVLEKALEGGRQLTRTELGREMEAAGIDLSMPQRLAHIVMHAELEALVCSGAMRGKQFTYALVDERVPPTPPKERDEALAELARRYFTSRGPATPQDFSWWSGLTVADATRAVQAAGPEFQRETIDGKAYWSGPPIPAPDRSSPTVFLLPNYDEYFIGFRDRGAILQRVRATPSEMWQRALFAHVVVVDGQLVGGWRRTLGKNSVAVELELVPPLTDAERAAVDDAVRRYGAFLGLAVSVTHLSD